MSAIAPAAMCVCRSMRIANIYKTSRLKATRQRNAANVLASILNDAFMIINNCNYNLFYNLVASPCLCLSFRFLFITRWVCTIFIYFCRFFVLLLHRVPRTLCYWARMFLFVWFAWCSRFDVHGPFFCNEWTGETIFFSFLHLYTPRGDKDSAKEERRCNLIKMKRMFHFHFIATQEFN